jgi:hypothetical protein
MLADRELGRSSWDAVGQTAGDLCSGFSICHRLSLIVDLGRPGDGLDNPAWPVLALGSERTWLLVAG